MMGVSQSNSHDLVEIVGYGSYLSFRLSRLMLLWLVKHGKMVVPELTTVVSDSEVQPRAV